MTRIAAVAALVVAVAVTAALLLSRRTHYTVHAVFSDAGQLVKGNRVTVGGLSIGTVKTIDLGAHNEAVVTLDITDDAFEPLHHGTIATIRAPSQSTQAGRYISLAPGPNNAAKLDDGATIGAEDTRGIVDLDELFNALDAQTRSSLQGIVHGMADQFGGGQAANANRTLAALNPALAQTQNLTSELVRDQNAFERFIVESAAVVGSIAPRDADLQHGITSASQLTSKLAEQDRTIGEVLDRAPGTLRQASRTLGDVDTALKASRPTLRAARPVAPRLAEVLKLVAPVARNARPAVRDLSALLPDVQAALRGLPELQRIGGQTFADTTNTLKPLSPKVAQLRPYVPDVVAGLINGFGGNVAGYYDANGRYARIGFELPPDFLVQGGQALGQPVSQLLQAGLGNGLSIKPPNYCPGGSTAPGDSSAPWVPDEVKGHCDAGQTPKP